MLLGLLLETTVHANNIPTKKITKITVQGAEYTYNYTFGGDIFISCSLNEKGYISNSEDVYFPIMLVGDWKWRRKMLFKWENDDMTQMNVG